MKKRFLVLILFILMFLGILSFVLSQSGFAIYQGQAVNEEYLENLRLKANVECLQNSQCSEGYECVKNKCINKDSINACQTVRLWTPTRKLKIGSNISDIKGAISSNELPNLLDDGKIIDIVNGKTFEYPYSPIILIGDSKIEKENEEYVIKSNNISNGSIYTLKIAFFKGIDFSSKSIRKQALRILGREYIIGEESTNSVIYLDSNNKKIKLENRNNLKKQVGLFIEEAKGTYINIIQAADGKVIMIEIVFNIQGKDKRNIKVNENYIEPAFNAIKLSFNYADDNFADVNLGGNC